MDEILKKFNIKKENDIFINEDIEHLKLTANDAIVFVDSGDNNWIKLDYAVLGTPYQVAYQKKYNSEYLYWKKIKSESGRQIHKNYFKGKFIILKDYFKQENINIEKMSKVSELVAHELEPTKEEEIKLKKEENEMENKIDVEIKVNGNVIKQDIKAKKEKSDYKKRAKVIGVYYRKSDGSKVKTEEFNSEGEANTTMQEPKNFEYKLVTYAISKVTEIKVPLKTKKA